MLDIINRTKQTLPKLPWLIITRLVLGSDYQLSLVLVGDATIKRLNKRWRGKDKVTNVLAFELDKQAGEIFLNLNRAKQEAKKFNRTYRQHVGALFIHALLHLKGYRHSSTMEEQEAILRGKFNLNGKNHSWPRHRYRLNPSGGV